MIIEKVTKKKGIFYVHYLTIIGNTKIKIDLSNISEKELNLIYDTFMGAYPLDEDCKLYRELCVKLVIKKKNI